MNGGEKKNAATDSRARHREQMEKILPHLSKVLHIMIPEHMEKLF